jgi:hypothetical protein
MRLTSQPDQSGKMEEATDESNNEKETTKLDEILNKRRKVSTKQHLDYYK